MEDFREIYPITHMHNVIDCDSGDNLYQYLTEYNHINLGYCADKITARNKVRVKDRKKGLYITYYINNNPITEVHIGSETIPNNNWSGDDNWQPVSETEVLESLIKADEEDITVAVEKGVKVFKFADKVYTPMNFTGKGIKILRRNIVEVIENERTVNKNILTQGDIDLEHTIYVIKYDFDLNGKEIAVPADSVLFLYGGTITNGTIRGNGTDIAGIGTISAFLRGYFTKFGVTLNRPNKAITGTCYFDTSLNKPIWFTGAYWVDAMGNRV